MKVCTWSAIIILSLTAIISLSTVVRAMVADRQLDRIDFVYSDDRFGSSQEPVGGAAPMKNKVKGPADLGVYYINSAGRSCGGLSTSQCSTSCSKLGYPVYWCYPQVCYCHYGTAPEVETNDVEPPTI